MPKITTIESRIIKEIEKTLELLGVYAWRNNTGVAKTGGRYIRYGKVGSGDFLGILAPAGQFLAIEAKAPGETQSEDQVEFQHEIESRGGLYLLVESGFEIVEPIKQAIKDGREKRRSS